MKKHAGITLGVLLAVFSCASAEAVQIKQVQSGWVRFAAADATKTVTLTKPNGVAVDPLKSISMINPTGGYGTSSPTSSDKNYFFTSALASSGIDTTLTIQRPAGPTVAMMVYWQVVEFASGVSVQRGATLMLATSLSQDVLIQAVNTAKAVPIVETRINVGTTNQTHEFFLRPSFLSSTILRLERNDATGSTSLDVTWQVIEFTEDTNVFTGTGTFTSGTSTQDQSISVNISGAGVPLKNPVLFTYFTGDTGINGVDNMLRVLGAVTNLGTTTTPAVLTFTRGYVSTGADDQVYIRYYLIDFTDGATTTVAKQQNFDTGIFPFSEEVKSSTGGTPIVITTGSSTVAKIHNLQTGDMVHIAGHNQDAANGIWRVTFNDATKFSLDGSAGTTGAGVSGRASHFSYDALSSAVDTQRTMIVGSSRTGPSTSNANSYYVAQAMFTADFALDRNGNQVLRMTRTAEASTTIAAISRAVYAEFGPLTLTAPTSAMSVTVGDVYTVRWLHADSVSAHPWKLEISSNGSVATPIWADMPSVCGAPSYNSPCTGTVLSARSVDMRIPDVLGADVRFRITDTHSSLASLPVARRSDASNNSFSIKRGLTLTSPVGGENWVVGDKTKYIMWNYLGEAGFGTLKLEYSKTGGGTASDWIAPNGGVIATGVARGSCFAGLCSGSYLWSPGGNGIPDLIGTNLRVRVISESDATISSASAASFNIKRSITLTLPTGTSSLTEQTAWDIRWTYTGETGWGAVTLQYSNNGGTWTNIATAQSKGTNGPFAGTGSYTGSSIPLGLFGPNFQVRVFSESDNTVVSTSPVFVIEPNLRLDSPNGEQSPKWEAGDTKLITWTRGAAVSNNLKVEYSTNGLLGPWTVIVASTPSKNVDTTHGSYSWVNIPGAAVGSNTRIKLTDIGTGVFDISDLPFTIKPSIKSISPGVASGESYNYGSNIVVVWTPNGVTGNVNILLSSDGGASYPTTLATVAVSPNSWPWSTGAQALGTSYKIRVRSVNDTTVYGDSANNFGIKGTVTVIAPNGGESWKIGDTKDITWNQVPATGFGNVDIAYSLNNGAAWFPIATNTAAPCVSGFCTYSWVLDPVADPNIKTSTQALIRVTKNGDAAVTDQSDGNFSIKGNLKVTSPVGGEAWDVASAHNIVWTSSPISQGNVKLEYLVAGVPTTITVAAGVPSSNLTYSWTVPDAISNQAKVRITSLTDSTITDTSTANFTIQPKFTLSAPNGGETWLVGEARNIAWTNTGTVNTVNLYKSFNGGSSWVNPPIVSGLTNLQSYDWSASGGVPDNIGATNRVKVEAVVNGVTVSDISDTNYTIKGSITVTSPNGLENLHVEDIFPITWDYKGTLGNVKVLYSTDGGVTYPDPANLIATVPASNRNYAWTVPDAIGSNVKVKVMQTGATPNDAFDESDQAFSIKGTITSVTSPVSGDAWVVGTVHPITWTTKGTNMGNVKIEYSTNGGVTYPSSNLITPPAGVPAGSPYNWTVPDNISGTVKVKVTLISDSTAFSESALFSIKGSLSLSSPTAASSWGVGTSQNITWTRNGSMGNLKVEYSTTGGAPYPNVIAASIASSALTQAWTIPDAIGSQVRVKITLLSDATTFAESPNFIIKGSLNLTAPTAASVWAVGSSQNITWTRNGASMGNAKIEYSTDGGATYPGMITASVATSALTQAWTIPDAIGSQVRVKITLLSDTATFSESPNFNIKGSLNLTSPAVSDVWIVGSNHAITWTKNGTMGNVKLEYSKDNGATFPDLITPALGVPASDLTFPWTVPNAIGNQVRVRVSLLSDATTNSVSPAFSIKGSFVVTSPNGGETWSIGENRPITWTTNGTMSNVKLSYSTDGGVTYPNVIAATVANSSPYTWAVPDAAGNALRVKVEDATDATVFDTSNADFTVKGSLTLTVPTAATVWTVGSSQNITWTRNGTLGNAKIEYSTNGGATYPNTITASVATSALTQAWAIPDAIGGQVRVRISLVSDATVKSESPNFSIKGSLGLVSPTAGDVWIVGSVHPIDWVHNGSMGKVKLEYSTDSGATYPNLITPIGGVDASLDTLNWAVPDDISSSARVKITLISDSTVNNESLNFAIKGSLALTSPVAGDSWAVGSSHAITWNKVGTMGNVKIEYSTLGGTAGSYITVTPVGGVPSSSSPFNWTVPDAVTNQAKVKITLLSDASVSSESPLFSIKGGLTLTSPVGGESWVVGDDHGIAWTRTGTMGNIKIEYSTDGGATYPNLLTPVGGIPSYSSPFNWTVPDAIGNRVRVRVSLLSDASVKSDSANFSIKGGLALTSPAGGETWTVEDIHPITWTKVGSVGNLKIEYSTDGGVTFANTIAASVPSSNLTFDWTVPDIIGSQVKVKVSSISDPTLKSESGVFTVKGSLVLTSPAGGENWIVGSSQIIEWDKKGTMANLKVEYSLNGAPYSLVASNVPASNGAFNWTLPDTIGRARVKITLESDATLSSESNLFFIKGLLNLTSPAAGDAWSVGSTHAITWTKTGTMGNAKLEYSTDGGATYTKSITSASGVASSLLSYNWAIPNDISSQVKVKMTLLSDPSTYSESPLFQIKGGLALTAPAAGDSWTVGSTHNIQWTRTGSMGDIRIEYSVNGEAYAQVAQVPSVDGTYAWTVPDDIGTATVRISLVSDSSVNSVSPNFFIKGSLALSSPNGGETWVVGDARDITWSTTGGIRYVNLYYTANSAAVPVVWTPINTLKIPNAPLYRWTVPDALGNRIQIKVEDADDPSVSDTSNANFKIAGYVGLTYPKNGGESWIIGSTANITWTKRGSFPFVKVEYSTNSGSSYNFVVTTDSTTGSYAWTIPDAAGSRVRVRVSNADDASVNDASIADSVIRAGFAFTVPAGGESWPVASAQVLRWTTGGTVSRIDLKYSVDDGATYAALASNISNNGSYNWTVPDSISANVRVKVSDTADPVASDISSSFKIQGVLALTSPRDGDRWTIGSSPTISWNKTGSISQVKLEYRKDVTGSVWNLIAGPIDADPSSFQWTLPDTIEDFIEVRVSDAAANDADAFASAKVKVIGQLTLTSPLGGERWVTFEDHNITWTTRGTVPKVNIEYSHDDFATSTMLAAAVNNSGTYAWTVPDPGMANVPKSTKIRVTDPSEANNTVTSNAFNIDYYHITWDVRDLVTNVPISALTVLETKNTDANVVLWQETGVVVPRMQPTPYGRWTATWSKAGYSDAATTVVATQDLTVTVYMETLSSHIWRSESQIAYNGATDITDVSAWLEKDGAIIPTVTTFELEVYKGAQLVTTVSAPGPDANGFFHTSIPAGMLQAGNTYVTVAKITISSGAIFRTPSSFEITTPAALQEVKNAIMTNLDRPLSQISSELQMTLAAQTQALNQKIDAQTAVISSTLGNQTAIIQSTLTSFESNVQEAVTSLESGAQQSLEASRELQITASKFSWKAGVSPNPAMTGSTVLLQVQGPTGLLPYVSIYNDVNRQIYVNAPLKESVNQPGVYAFEFKASASDFAAGKSYTYIVTEDTTGALVAGSGSIESVSLDTIASLASSGAGAERAAREAVTAIKELETSLSKGGDIRKALSNLQTSVNGLPSQMAKLQGQDSKKIGSQVKEISERLQKLAGDEGLDFQDLFKAAIDESSTIQDIRGRSETISHSVDLLGAVVQKRLGGEDTPVVAVMLE